MKQANGIGSRVSLAAIGTACLCAECIPVMIGATLIAVGGIAWDFARGNVTGNKKSRRVRTSHKAAGRKTTNIHHYYVG